MEICDSVFKNYENNFTSGISSYETVFSNYCEFYFTYSSNDS